MSCSGLVLNLKDYAWLLEAFPVAAIVGTDAYNVSLLFENFHVSGNGSPGDASLLCQGRGCFCDIFCVIERYQLYDKTLSISQFICDIICDIICVTTEPWRKRLGESDGKIDIPVCQLEFRLGKTVLFAEVEDVRNTSAPGFHQAALEEDFADEFVDGLGLGPFVEGFRGGAWRKSAGVGEFYTVVEDSHGEDRAIGPPRPVNEDVKGGFPDDFIGNGEGVDSFLLVHGAGEEHVLAAEVQDGVVLIKEIAFTDGLVAEDAHIGSLEACKLEFTLGNLPGWILAE